MLSALAAASWSEEQETKNTQGDVTQSENKHTALPLLWRRTFYDLNAFLQFRNQALRMVCSALSLDIETQVQMCVVRRTDGHLRDSYEQMYKTK